MRQRAFMVLLVVSLAAARAQAAPLSAATPVVEAFHRQLLVAMRDADGLGFAGRQRLLAPAVEAGFDLPFITRLILGRYWSALDEGARQRVIAAFSALTIATYAARFDGYSGQRFETLETRELKAGKALVRTALVDAEGDRVRLDYVLRGTAGGWRVVNVLADGVSEIAIKRADYGRQMRKHGLDALVSRIDAQRARLAERS